MSNFGIVKSMRAIFATSRTQRPHPVCLLKTSSSRRRHALNLNLNFSKAYWITGDTTAQLDQFISSRNSAIAYDKEENPVYLSESEWMLKMIKNSFSAIHFHTTSEFKNKKCVATSERKCDYIADQFVRL